MKIKAAVLEAQGAPLAISTNVELADPGMGQVLVLILRKYFHLPDLTPSISV